MKLPNYNFSEHHLKISKTGTFPLKYNGKRSANYSIIKKSLTLDTLQLSYNSKSKSLL